jgi:23S rRNA pseudouridine1911/1915/1917 synthase
VDRLPGLPALSRARIQGWIRSGRVRVDGMPVARPSQRLVEGQRLDVLLDPAPARTHLAQPLDLDIVYEDDAMLAINKPADLVVHPTRRYPEGTLVNALLWHLRAAGQTPPVARLVHRLDRQTSGLLVVAKRREVHAALARAMARRAVDKTYLALVYGTPRSAKDRIDLRIVRDPAGRLTTSRVEGQTASTIVELVGTTRGSRAGLSLLRCTLVTGRLHQIRVHLAGVGLPIVGDPLYRPRPRRRPSDPALASGCLAFPRQALHAWRLRLAHPVTGTPLDLTAPVPPDLARLLSLAGLDVAAGGLSTGA